MFLASGLLITGATFAISTLGLGMDFYPRLVGVAYDHRACNATVNEQTQASLLMAGPGILATITFAPLVVALL